MFLRKIYYLKKAFEFWESASIEKHQKTMLKNVLEFSRKNVDFYKNYRTSEHIEELPSISRGVVDKNWKKFQSDKSAIKRATTSTTGTQLQVFYDKRGLDYMEAVFLRHLLLLGYKPWQEIFYYWPKNEKRWYNTIGLMKKFYVIPKLSIDEQVDLILNKKPKVIYYFSDALYYVAKKMEYLGAKPREPKLIVTQGEILTKTMRKTIERVFGAKVYDQYAMTEFVNIACQDKNGDYVINEDALIVLVEKNGRLRKYGKGEIVITSLVNYGMPLINYKTGDVGRILKGKKNFRRLEIFGRKEFYKNNKSPEEQIEALLKNKRMFKFRIKNRKVYYSTLDNKPLKINGEHIRDIKPLKNGKMGLIVN